MAILFPSLTATSVIQLLAITFTVWSIAVGIYRVFFHPLAKIPGPKLAGLTYLYRFKYNVLDHGKFYLQIEKLHQKYGPVVRITPNEIHLSDSSNHDKIHHIGSKFYKDDEFYRCLGLETAAVVTPSNELHRIRRGRLAPMFSRAKVLELEDVVQARTEKLCGRIAEAFEAGGSVNLHYGFRAVSVDVITEYAWGNCYELLSRPNFGKEYFDSVSILSRQIWTNQQFPFLDPIMRSFPLWLAMRLFPTIGPLVAMRSVVEGGIKSIQAQIASGEETPKRKTIFHHLLESNEAKKDRKADSMDHLIIEGIVVLSAATDTTGGTLTIATLNILSDSDIYRTLMAELKAAFPDPTARLDFLTLEKLPYLTGVIKEALRLSWVVPGRLPRVAAETVEFNGYSVPAGTVIGMSAWHVHRDPSIFPEPDKFLPSRWLDRNAREKLDRYLITFGKGSRQCLGIQLAYCELYVILATVFRRFEQLKAYESGLGDYAEFDDYFSSYHNKTGRTLRVVGGTNVLKSEVV